MDGTPELTSATKVVEALAAANERLADFAIRIRSQPGVREVTRDLDLRALESGTLFWPYVDVELESHEAVCWGLECKPMGSCWTLDSSVSIVRGEYQETVVEFPTRQVRDLDELIAALHLAVGELLDAHEVMKFSRP